MKKEAVAVIICAWCKKKFGKQKGMKGISHGICPRCQKIYFPKTKKKEKTAPAR